MSPNESIDDCIVDLEPQYQSPQDAQIGNLLDLYGIPFLYRHPMVVEDKGQYQTIYPAFTLPSYGGVIIDYAHRIYGEEYVSPEERPAQVPLSQYPARHLNPQEYLTQNRNY